MTDIPETLRSCLASRASENFYAMIDSLRSLSIDGMDTLIKAVVESDFALANSVKHHAYTSGTLEHTLGVFSKMRETNLQHGNMFCDAEIAIVGYLHDICMASHPEWDSFPDLHGVKSGDIIRKYLPDVVDTFSEALFAIEHHGSKFHDETMVKEHPLLSLLLRCDKEDAEECKVGQIIL